MTREQWEALRACVEVAEDDNPLWYTADETLVQIGRANGWLNYTIYVANIYFDQDGRTLLERRFFNTRILAESWAGMQIVGTTKSFYIGEVDVETSYPTEREYPANAAGALLKAFDEGEITSDALALATTAQPACDGAMDSDDKPICHGPDVQCCHAEAPDGKPFIAHWCSECRELAIHDGYQIHEQHPID